MMLFIKRLFCRHQWEPLPQLTVADGYQYGKVIPDPAGRSWCTHCYKIIPRASDTSSEPR
jgi:hypothetical protein